MKKVFAIVFVLSLLFLFVGCNSQQAGGQPQSSTPTPTADSTPTATAESAPVATPASTPTATATSTPVATVESTPTDMPVSTPTPTPTSTPAPVAVDSLDFLPLEFEHLSGAGAWRSTMIVNPDGSFTGHYRDSDMGACTDEYPNGTEYVCDFSGKFTNMQKINDYTYSFTLAELQIEREAGEKWIENGIRYIATNAPGLSKSMEFMLYTPDAPTEALSEVFLSWWTLRSEWPETLSCYGIRNVETEDGYFSEKIA